MTTDEIAANLRRAAIDAYEGDSRSVCADREAVQAILDERGEMQLRIREMEEALRFYGNELNWCPTPRREIDLYPWTAPDLGERARQALGQKEEGSGE